MRTTLKRGLGRGAARTETGRRCCLPGSTSPVTFYRQPERSSRSRAALVGRIAMWLGIACLVVASGTAGGAYLYFHESVAAVAAKTPEVQRAARQRSSVALPGQPAVALVIGYDRRKADEPERRRSLRHAHARPRRPGRPTRSRCSRSRATCASRSAVPAARRSSTRSTPRTPLRRRRARSRRSAGLTGVQINYLITVNFRGFRQIVDQPRRGLDRRRPALLQRPRRPVRVREDQPPARLPAAERDAGRSTTSASATPTPTSTASRGSSSS